MAGFVLRNAAVKIAGTDFSDHMLNVAVNMTAADVDVTTMGAGGHQHLAGIRDDSFTLQALSDFAAASLDAVIYPQFNGASAFLVEVWAAGTTSSTVNPKYSGTCILTEYTPISGGVGDAAQTPLTLPVNGVITRATA